MVSPVYALQQWLANLLGVNYEAPVLAVVFAMFLVFEPLLLIGVAAWLTRLLEKRNRSFLSIAVRYSYSLVPLGFGIWFFFFNVTATTEIYTLSLHDALR